MVIFSIPIIALKLHLVPTSPLLHHKKDLVEWLIR